MLAISTAIIARWLVVRWRRGEAAPALREGVAEIEMVLVEGAQGIGHPEAALRMRSRGSVLRPMRHLVGASRPADTPHSPGQQSPPASSPTSILGNCARRGGRQGGEPVRAEVARVAVGANNVGSLTAAVRDDVARREPPPTFFRVNYFRGPRLAKGFDTGV